MFAINVIYSQRETRREREESEKVRRKGNSKK
jgi:hypothetical protein